MDTTDEDDVIAIGDVARIYGVTPDTIRRWEQEGRGVPHTRTAGGQRRYRRGDVLRLMAQCVSEES